MKKASVKNTSNELFRKETTDELMMG